MRSENLALVLYLFVGAALATSACGEAQVETQTGDSSFEARMEQVENGLIEFTETGPAALGDPPASCGSFRIRVRDRW